MKPDTPDRLEAEIQLNVWESRMTKGLTPLTAMAAFRAITKGSLEAKNPNGTNKSIRVAFNLEDDGDHTLFKSDTDTHGREFKGQQRPHDFMQDRADRLGWIPHVLLEPDAIYLDNRNYNNLVYVCSTLQDEQFLVVIHKQDAPKGSFFYVTALGKSAPEWEEDKRGRRYSRLLPAKGKAKTQKKGQRTGF